MYIKQMLIVWCSLRYSAVYVLTNFRSVPSVSERAMLKFPIMIVGLSVSPTIL